LGQRADMPEARVIPLRSKDPRLEEERAAAARIVQGVRAGDAAAENELVERYSRGLRFLLLRRIGDDERVRDLLQETFMIAFEKLRENPLDKPERLAGYLKGIAGNVAKSGVRKRIREPTPMAQEAVDAIPDNDQRPFRTISAEQSRSAVQKLLESMTVERDRELLRRFYIYDQDKPDICRALGLDSLHFNRVLYRAKNRFREILEAHRDRSDLVDD